MGRRKTLTPDLLKKLVNVISAGNYIKVACQYVGISEAAFYKWGERGRAEIERIEAEEEATGTHVRDDNEYIYVEFVESIMEAEVAAEVACVTNIRVAAGNGNVQAAIAYLERKHNKRWGKKDRHHIELEQTKKYDFSNVPTDELERAEAILALGVIEDDEHTEG